MGNLTCVDVIVIGGAFIAWLIIAYNIATGRGAWRRK